MRARRLGLALVLLAGLLASVPARASRPGFVYSQGSRLMVDGKPWQAIGVNFWDMDAGKVLSNDLTGCYYQHADLDSYFDQSFHQIALQTHATVVRTFGFREWFTASGRDWSSTDKLLHYARLYNIRVIPVLGDQYAACGLPKKTPSWYTCDTPGCIPGYKQRTVWGDDFRTYVINAVKRYKNDPAVAFWQLMNEPLYGQGGAASNTLTDFSRDMVSAIRNEAGDTDHLISAGATGQITSPGRSPNTDLLSCGPQGGCSDIAEVHDYTKQPFHGIPLPSYAAVRLVASNAYDGDYVTPPTVAYIDSWTDIKANVPQRVTGRPNLYWSILITVVGAPQWTMYLDDAIVSGAGGPQTYTFETGDEGFEVVGGLAQVSSDQAHTGLRSLKVTVPEGTTRIDVRPPLLKGTPTTLQASIRLAFDAPSPDIASVAGVMHTAVVTMGKPYETGEVGMRAAVAGMADFAPLPDPPDAKCLGTQTTTAQRAQTFNDMLSRQVDDIHRNSGFMVWDWKDPVMTWTAPDGTPKWDPTISCYAVMPGDPATGVLATWADKTIVDPLPAPDPLPPAQASLIVLRGPLPTAPSGGALAIQARVTNGGNPVRDASVYSREGCVGSGRTNALGIAAFTCRTALVTGTIKSYIGIDPSTCCDVPEVSYTTALKRAIRVQASSRVVERGRNVPIDVVVSAVDAGPVQGLTYHIPACGVDGIVDAAAFRVMCPSASLPDGTSSVLVTIDETPTSLPAVTGVTIVVFDHLWRDPKTLDCIALPDTEGFVGLTQVSGHCTEEDAGSPNMWSSFKVTSDSFTNIGTMRIVNVTSGANRILGVFTPADDTFTAFVARGDGDHLWSNP